MARTITEKNRDYAFQKGWAQIKTGEVAQVREKMKAQLNITTRAGFLNRLNGLYEPKISEYQIIEKIFNEHGITDIWGRLA